MADTLAPGRRPALDGVRGVAIVYVVMAHAAPYTFPGLGATGVSVFFALSGFLITSILVSQDRINLREFYSRRAVRLFPALAAFLLTMVVLGVLVSDMFVRVPRDVLPVLFYYGNWRGAFGDPMQQLDHTWSLAVEEQFYLVLPLLLVALTGRLRARGLFWLVTGLAALSASERLLLVAVGADADRIYQGTDTTACLLLVGASAAIGLKVWGSPRARPRLAVAALALAFPLAFVTEETGARTVSPVVAALLTVVALLALAGGYDRGVLASRWLTLVGRRSYALYLWHFPLTMLVSFVISDNHVLPHWLATVLCVAAAWGLALLSWRYVEQPAQEWYQRRKSPQPEGQGLSVAVSGEALA